MERRRGEEEERRRGGEEERRRGEEEKRIRGEEEKRRRGEGEGGGDEEKTTVDTSKSERKLSESRSVSGSARGPSSVPDS